MRGESKQILIGFLVLAGLALFIASRYAAGPPEPPGGMRIGASFGYVGSLAVGDEVRMGGIPVGRVTEVSLDPETYRAEIVMVVAGGTEIPTDSAAKVVSDGLVGGAHVDVDIGGALEVLGDGDSFEITQEAINLIELVGRLVFVDGGNGEDADGVGEGGMGESSDAAGADGDASGGLPDLGLPSLGGN